MARTNTNTGSAGGVPGGLNTQVQYNHAGAFGGSAGATADATKFYLVDTELAGNLAGMGYGISRLSFIVGETGGALALRTNTANADTLTLSAYDVDGAAYAVFATLTAANVPTWVFGQNIGMGSHFLRDLLDPALAQDAATKAYVDSLVNGLSWKTSVQVATVSALPASVYANGALGVGATITSTNGAFPPLGTIDGYVPVLNDRILVKNQVAGLQQGIYTLTQQGDNATVPWVLTRATDNDQAAEQPAAACSVANGTVNGGAAFTQTVPAPIIMGTTVLSWSLFLNSIYTAGAGLALSMSHVFSLDVSHANTWLAKQTFASGMFELAGLTSGFCRINAKDITTTYSLKMPGGQGALNDTLLNDGSGNLSWGPGSGSAGITALTGDVTATGPGSAAATIAANAVTYPKSYNGTQLAIVSSLRYLTGN